MPDAQPKSNVALAALVFGAFVIGTAELVVVGVIDLIADDTGVSISTAGQLVTAYALGIAFGAPLIAVLTTRFGRRVVLRASLTAFLAGNLLTIVATSFDIVLGGRAADRNATLTLLCADAALIGALGALYLIGATPILVVVALAAWGVAGFAIAPAVQLRAVTLAGAGSDLAATLGVSAFNAGIAGGSLVGGAVIARQGADATVLAAIVLCAVALPAIWATRILIPPADAEDNGRGEVEHASRPPQSSGPPGQRPSGLEGVLRPEGGAGDRG